MPSSSTEALAAHLSAVPGGADGLVFTNTQAGRCAAAPSARHGIERPVPAQLPEWATFHDLRHFYASLLIARGCSVKAVQQRLGHQSAMETLDTYSHLWPDSDDETRAAIDMCSVPSPSDRGGAGTEAQHSRARWRRP